MKECEFLEGEDAAATGSSGEYDSDGEPFLDTLSPEDWQDWYSEDLLNVWMSIVEYHQDWYLPLRRTFNEFCDFVRKDPDDDECEVITDEVMFLRTHPFVRGRNWYKFFFSRPTLKNGQD